MSAYTEIAQRNNFSSRSNNSDQLVSQEQQHNAGIEFYHEDPDSCSHQPGLYMPDAIFTRTVFEVDRYKVSSVEKGTPLTEEIEVDVKQDVEVFRVPAHNDVDAADFYHDFKMRVTVTKVLSRKVCYIANMDPSVSSPAKLKEDIARAASQSDELPVTTQEHLVVVTGPANRLSLTKEILDFCGALPIYKTEVFPNPVKEQNGTFIVRATTRQRRQTSFTLNQFTSCLVSQGRHPLKYILDGKCLKSYSWDLECKVKSLYRNFYFYVKCVDIYRHLPIPGEYVCTTQHRTAKHPKCCDYRCPIPVT
ncbi:uncharacterized protein LOC144666683 [Oculina patagonica]